MSSPTHYRYLLKEASFLPISLLLYSLFRKKRGCQPLALPSEEPAKELILIVMINFALVNETFHMHNSYIPMRQILLLLPL